MRPAERAAILSSSLSTQMTSLPRSAKTAPVTSPTYPVPATQMFIRTGGKDYSRAHRRGAGAKLTAPRAAPARVSTGAAAHRARGSASPGGTARPPPLFVRLGGRPAEEDPREGGKRRDRGRHPHDHAAEPPVLEGGEREDAGRRGVERIERRGGQRDERRDHRHRHAHQEQVEQLRAV